MVKVRVSLIDPSFIVCYKMHTMSVRQSKEPHLLAGKSQAKQSRSLKTKKTLDRQTNPKQDPRCNQEATHSQNNRAQNTGLDRGKRHTQNSYPKENGSELTKLENCMASQKINKSMCFL